jgi:hypothetical protein
MTETPPMMKCGHAANGKKGDQPVCVICFGLRAGSDEIAPPLDLEGRTARCHCGVTVPSSVRLAFFEHRPDGATGMDGFYCGHAGWD